MNTYFKNVQTLDGLRKQYKDLLKRYRPDNGGSEEAAKAINIEYEKLFKILKDKHSRQDTADNKTSDKQSSYDNMDFEAKNAPERSTEEVRMSITEGHLSL